MKINRRRQSLDFGALTEGPAPELEEVEPIEAAPDFDLAPADPPEMTLETAAGRDEPAPVPARPREAAPAAPPSRQAANGPPQPEAPRKVATPIAKAEAKPSAPAATPKPRAQGSTLRTAPSNMSAPRKSSDTSAVKRGGLAAPSAWPIYAGAAVASVLWAGTPIAFAWGYRQEVMPFQYDPFALAVFALLALGPTAMVWIAAYLARQGQLLAAEAARAKALADDMVSPAVIAAGRAGDLALAVRAEIARAGQTADAARSSLHALREALAEESERLVGAAADAERRAAGLAEAMGRERSEMSAMAQTLETQATHAVEAIDRQARVVAEASDLAETQIREAEASLTARAADLTAAAGAASDVARTAGEDLTRQVARLEAAGAGVAEQISTVEAGLGEQRAALLAASHGLRADQEVFAAEAESQTAKLSEFIGQARQSASEMGERAIQGADALRHLIAEAADQFRDFSDQAKIEREAFGASTRYSLEAVAAAASRVSASSFARSWLAIEALVKASEETRQAAEGHSEAARAQVDQLAEAAFTAGQRANQVFEARLSEARDLIERSAQMVEQAGEATARKLDQGAEAARGTLQELERMLSEIEGRAAQLPMAARQQAEDVRKAVIESMDELMQHARRTAEETEAIDLAFQERVRRNYEMLSEAVRMMGTVASGSTGPPSPPSVERSAPRPPPRQAVEPTPSEASAERGLRQRLRLTPTATDEEFSSVFEAAGGRAEAEPEGAEGWTWKELLSSIDDEPGAPGEVSEARLEETLVAEVLGMGIDPAALLPRARLEEIADLLEAGEGDACRTLVRKLAPAATRRLARRLFTDPALKQQVRLYVARHQRMVENAVKRDRDGPEPSVLLATDAGRAFLLLDAAGGDAG